MAGRATIRGLVCGLLAGVSAAGCASRVTIDEHAAVAPADFTIAITVLAPAGQAGARRDAPRWMRPGRYLVEPGGRLRAWTGPSSAEVAFPPEARVLPPHEVDRLWRLAQEAGVLDPTIEHRVTPVLAAGPVRGQTTAVFTVRRQGAYVLSRLPLDETPTAASGLVDRVARLAWVPE